MTRTSDLVGRDVERYLESHGRKGLLRFITCGSVDDGKSTLIGRLLYESKVLYEDQIAALTSDSKKFGTQGDDLDFALLLDGLTAEREQGITIDVAYRFFSTDKRNFIVADTPGHEQYTRNMVTGASTADVAVILIDARKGVLTQTRRHSYLVSLLGIRKVALAVNKLDLIDYSQEVFEAIEHDYRAFARQIGLADIVCIPLSALKGDNVTAPSPHTPWYRGPSLMGYLEDVAIDDDAQERPFRMPVQWVNRPNLDFRGFSGRVVGGSVRPGDRVRVLPSGKEATVARIVTKDGDLERAVTGQSITLTLDTEIDASRGDLFASARFARRHRRPVRGRHHLDERGRDAGGTALPAEDRGEDRRRHDGRAQVQGQRQHARAPRREDAASERDRRVQPQSRPADRLRSVRGEPRHRRLHPDRPDDQQHGRRGTPALRAASVAEHPLAGDRGQQGSARARSRAIGRAWCGSPDCPAPGSRRSPISSRRSSTRWAATPICSTATTCATVSTRTWASPKPTASRTSAASPRSRG